MDIEQHVVYSIDKLPVKPDGSTDYHGGRERIYELDMTRTQWAWSGRRLEWIRARFVYLNPTAHLSTSLSFYDKKTGLDVGFNSALGKLRAAKGQVTKMENLIADYVAGFRPTLFVKTAEETDAYKKAVEKLDAKRAELECAERQVELEKSAIATNKDELKV